LDFKTHLVLFSTSFFIIVINVVPGVILWGQQGLFDYRSPPHKQQEQQDQDWSGRERGVGA
jgi:hypothetical protein